MENNELKENIRKKVREKIAVSKIRKEFDMKNNKNKKLVYGITSSVAIFILGFGMIMVTNTSHNLDNIYQNYEISNLEKGKQNVDEDLKINLQINKIGQIAEEKIDGQIETELDAKAENIDLENIDIEKLPDQFKIIKNINVPQGFKLNNMYKVYIKSNIEIKKYDLLHDYVISYVKDKEHDIRISISTIGKPLRDYSVEGNNKISTIKDVELKIYQYNELYMSTFKIKDMYFDIEANGITQDELLELLQSIITKSNI